MCGGTVHIRLVKYHIHCKSISKNNCHLFVMIIPYFKGKKEWLSTLFFAFFTRVVPSPESIFLRGLGLISLRGKTMHLSRAFLHLSVMLSIFSLSLIIIIIIVLYYRLAEHIDRYMAVVQYIVITLLTQVQILSSQ